MIYLSIDAILRLYDRVLKATGGTAGLRDRAGLESALPQPRMTFGGQDLYVDLESKAAALAYSLIKNHPFVDGNKRVGFAAMDAFRHYLKTPLGAGSQWTISVEMCAIVGMIP